MNEPLTLQELVKMDGQVVWLGEPFNEWHILKIEQANMPEIKPDMAIRSCWVEEEGVRKDLPMANFYRYPPDMELPISRLVYEKEG